MDVALFPPSHSFTVSARLFWSICCCCFCFGIAFTATISILNLKNTSFLGGYKKRSKKVALMRPELISCQGIGPAIQRQIKG